jgi:F420-non-reducing hydrogenase small subunit
MSALASVIDSEDPDEIARIIEEGIPDPVGSFYRFNLAASLLRRRKRSKNGNGAEAETTRAAAAPQ